MFAIALLSTTLSMAHTASELKEVANQIIQKANVALKADFQIEIEKNQLNGKLCEPQGFAGKVYLCDGFFEHLSKSLPADEQETALAFILSHEVMHSYFTEGVSHSRQEQISKKLNLDPNYVSRILYLFWHENIDWAATKLMIITGYHSIGPALVYLDILANHPDYQMNLVMKKVLQFRKTNLIHSFNQGLQNDRFYRATISPCNSYSSQGTLPSGETKIYRSPGKYLLGSFLESHIDQVSPQMLKQCEEFAIEDIESAVMVYYNELKGSF